MKTLLLAGSLAALASFAGAADTTPPTLTILNTWCEKEGTKTHFKMYLDIRDDTGLTQFDTLEFRSALNTTALPPATAVWHPYPWIRGQAFDVPFTCTAVSFEFKAKDAAGNYCAVQRRTFKAPFPYLSEPPTLTPRLATSVYRYYGHAPSSCQGLFAGKFNLTDKDALLSVDRTTGNLRILQPRATFGFEEYENADLGFTPNTITDSAAADFDGDGRMDVALLANGVLGVYHNDGTAPDGKILFSPGTGNTTGTLITNIQHIATGDLTGEGKPEIVLTGTDANGDMRVGYVINDGVSNMNGANSTLAVPTTETGRIAVADMNGDGHADVVVVDKTNNQMVIYKSKGIPFTLAGNDEVDAALQPVVIPTGFGSAGPPPPDDNLILTPLPVDALAIGDVTGDGRPDIVTVMRWLRFVDDGRTQHRWRLWENRGSSGFKKHPEQELGSSPISDTVIQEFTSDVLLQDLDENGLPELIFTDYFHDGLQINRITPQLNAVNNMQSFELETFTFIPHSTPGSGQGPHTKPARLVTGVDFTNTNHKGSFGVFFDGSDSMMWIANITSPSSLDRDIVGGCITDSDDTGVMGTNGIRTYSAFAGDAIYNSITAINNTGAEMTDVFIDYAIPSNVSSPLGDGDPEFPDTDPDWYSITISGHKYIRWKVTIPPNDAVVRKLKVRILSGTVNSFIYGAAYLRPSVGTTPLAGVNMPFVKLGEPVDVKVTAVTDSDAFGGDTAHAEEKITYSTRIKNQGEGTLAACKGAFAIPTNTLFVSTSGVAALDVNNFTYLTTALGTFHSDGQADVGLWESFTLHTTGRMVMDPNGRLQVCTTAGTTGSMEPVWATGNNKTTTDGTVTWTCKGQVTALSWPDFDLQAQANVTFATVVKIYPNIGVGDSTAAAPKITCKGVSVTRPTNIKQTAPAVVTDILPQLEMDLSVTPIIARPGELVTCVLTVHNYGLKPITNAKAVYKLPEGITIENVYTPDHADAPDGQGNFDADPLAFSQLYTVTNPVYDPATRVLSWSLGQVPANVARRLKFQVQVQYDLAGHYYTGGQYNAVNVVNGSYNFAATGSLGKRLFAALPPSIPAATPVNAATSLLLSSKVPARTIQISEDDPIEAPTLTVRKFASADGRALNGIREIPTVINDTGVSTDGNFTYSFEWSNIIDIVNGPVPGTARQVAIRDYIPSGVNFKGFITRSFVPVSNSFLGYKFYDASDKQFNLALREPFTDTNGSGFWEAGEPYTDNLPHNNKYDGVTAAAVRGISFPVGDVPGHQSGIIQYQVQAIKAAGFLIESLPALLQKTGVLTYTLTKGYHTTASNLLFPVPSANLPVQVLTTDPGRITIPSGVLFSRDEAIGNQPTEVGFIIEVTGAAGVTVSGMKASIPIPAGLQVFAAQIFNVLGNAVGVGTVSTTNTGVARTLNFDVGALRDATVKFQIAPDAVNGAKLRNNATAEGYTTAPIKMIPAITGGFSPAAPPPLASAALRKLSAIVNSAPPPSPTPLAAAAGFGILPILSNPDKDSKIFVGRVAPATVRRGGTFTYTIFAGNLTELPLDQGTISMKVPVGCTALSVKRYSYNALQSTGADFSGFVGDVVPSPADKNAPGYSLNTTWTKPLAAGTKISMNISVISRSEGGAMQITMKMDDGFKGNRIDDSSCVFDVTNASGKSSGPLGIVVLDTDKITDYPTTVQLLMEGLGTTCTPEVRDVMIANLQANPVKAVITTGGCQMLQMLNGTNIVQLPKDRVLVMGSPLTVAAPTRNIVMDDPAIRIAVGAGTSSGGIELRAIPNQLPALAFNPNSLLISASQAGGIVAAGGGNIVAAGGGNIVAAGGGNLTQANVKFAPPEGAPQTAIADTGAHLIGENGAGIVAAGGGNIVAAGGGNIVAAGGGNIVAAGGGNVKDPLGIVAAGGGNIVAAGGGNIVAAGGGNIVAAGGGNIVAAGGGNLIGAGGSTLIGAGGSTLIGAGGSTLAPANFK